jgi:hypothetical protein
MAMIVALILTGGLRGGVAPARPRMDRLVSVKASGLLKMNCGTECVHGRGGHGCYDCWREGLAGEGRCPFHGLMMEVSRDCHAAGVGGSRLCEHDRKKGRIIRMMRELSGQPSPD